MRVFERGRGLGVKVRGWGGQASNQRPGLVELGAEAGERRADLGGRLGQDWCLTGWGRGLGVLSLPLQALWTPGGPTSTPSASR